ncbi:MAG TPA: hypothetical protein VEA16_02575 [Vicinamibacterales bacterium]|nr:hypothetical protein [Vicinamibacterales bacterium]
MTLDLPVATRFEHRSYAWRLGAASTAAIGVVLTAWALTIDFPKASVGFAGDASTYYTLGHSLAHDLDFEFRRDDLARVWREYPSGPEGIFLKRGNGGRIYYAKSYIYPLVAAPFIWLFGTNGFLVLHALLMTACFACAYAFLAARSHPVAAVIFAFGFLFVSLVPVYMVQLGPDFFIFAVVLLAYFFWCYKEVAGPAPVAPAMSWRTRWLLATRSDTVAAALLGVATFAKPTNIGLIMPLLVSAALRKQWARAARISGVFTAVVVALFALNTVLTGDWNYQGGERKTFYGQGDGTFAGGFPYQNEASTFDTVGTSRVGGGTFSVLFTRDALLEVLPHNLGYFLFGRHTGFAVYFLPGMMAILLFLAATRDRAMWQWLTLAAGVITAVVLLIYMPFTWSGGGGPVGNRYFLGTYGVFLFLVPPLQTAIAGVVTIALSALFVAPLISGPLHATRNPAEHSKSGLFRWLPTELTMVNDLPINNVPPRIRQPLGGEPPMFAYFIDDNVYNREGDAFWVRGESTADILLRARIETEARAAGGEVARSLRIEKLTAILESGPKANRVVINTGGDRRIVDLAPSSQQTIELAMPHGMPYKYDPRYPTNYVYMISISSASGFVPMFENGASDSRFLGVMVRLIPTYGAPE